METVEKFIVTLEEEGQPIRYLPPNPKGWRDNLGEAELFNSEGHAILAKLATPQDRRADPAARPKVRRVEVTLGDVVVEGNGTAPGKE